VHQGSRSRLLPHSAELFPADTLFGKIARVLARASCVPRKELFESWEVAKRTQRRLSRTKLRPKRIVDLACGHGITGAILALIEPDIEQVLAIDLKLPPCAAKSLREMEAAFPQLVGRYEAREASIEDIALTPDDLVVSVHACGSLTDLVLDRATAARAMVSVLPCCHRKHEADTGGLLGWVDFSLAIDLRRAERLRQADFDVFTQAIAEEITPKNRLLIGVPRAPRDVHDTNNAVVSQ
jgi:hypothetical protein